MTIYGWTDQTLPAPTEQEIELVDNDAVLPSLFTGAVQTLARPKIWRMACSWMNITGGERADLIAFFMKLNGREHRVRMPFFGQIQRGELGGTPVVDGASQTGNSINIRGASLTQTDWAKAGDILRWGNTIHMATADADSDGAGDVTVNIIPEIRNSPADAASVAVSASTGGVWIMQSSVKFSTSAQRQQMSGDYYSPFTATFIDDVRAD